MAQPDQTGIFISLRPVPRNSFFYIFPEWIMHDITGFELRMEKHLLRLILLLVTAGLYVPAIIAAGQSDFVEAIYYNGNIVTVDDEFSIASAIAVRDGRFFSVGNDKEVLALATKETRRFDLDGRTVLPGFIDTHIHALSSATWNTIDLVGTTSVQEMLDVIRQKADSTESGKWILSKPLISLDNIREGRLPYREELDSAAPDHPVVISYHGHLMAVNSVTLGRAGITKEKAGEMNKVLHDVGGAVLLDSATGEPNGWLIERAAMAPVLRIAHSSLTESQIAERIRTISHRLNAAGLTGVIEQVAGNITNDTFRGLARLRREGKLSIRWRFNYRYPEREIPPSVDPVKLSSAVRGLGLPSGFGDEWLRIGSMGEMGVDGWWEPLDTAYLRQPYVTPFSRVDGYGSLFFREEYLVSLGLAAIENDIQMSVHAAGDAALDFVLDAYSKINDKQSITSLRWTIEHGGGLMPTKNNVDTAHRLGVIITSQPSIPYYNSETMAKRLGRKRVAEAFPVKSWLEGDVIVAGGSDFPVSPFNPLLGIHMAVTRTTASGEVLGKEQAISREQAIRMYTHHAAHISFEENIKGSIEVGKLADFVILSDDILSVPEQAIRDISVLATVVGGQTVYRQIDGLF
jgi:hypothetical protein